MHPAKIVTLSALLFCAVGPFRIAVGDVLPDTLDHALLVILDASGSMKEAVEGSVKADLARRGLAHTLGQLPVTTSVALRVLGFGDDDECASSEFRLPFAPFEPGAWDRSIASLPWNGSTPLTFAIRKGLEDLSRIDARRKEMLVVGDGEEVCGEDPVAVAREEANGIRIHTISLGERISHQLAGVALVTGGTYRLVIDESSFAAATEDALPTAPTTELSQNDGAPGPILELIVDVSNSMWGQIAGRSKMAIAQEAVQSVLAELPENVRVALRVYGHRVSSEQKEESCRDTELIVSAEPGNTAGVIAAVQELVPKGQTPLAASLLAAAADLELLGGPSVLLVVTDGIESCGGDPIAVAEQIQAGGQQVVLHTVGLGVDSDAAEALTALASAGGGSYFDAPSSADLMEGMRVAVESTTALSVESQEMPSFPAPVSRVEGGSSIDSTQVIEPGYFSLTDHLEKANWRYFAVEVPPGSEIELGGMVCALATNPAKDGSWRAQGVPTRFFLQVLDAEGERLRGRAGAMYVRGDMGEWHRLRATAGSDGLIRFRVGAEQSRVARDILFELRI